MVAVEDQLGGGSGGVRKRPSSTRTTRRGVTGPTGCHRPTQPQSGLPGEWVEHDTYADADNRGVETSWPEPYSSQHSRWCHKPLQPQSRLPEQSDSQESYADEDDRKVETSWP